MASGFNKAAIARLKMMGLSGLLAFAASTMAFVGSAEAYRYNRIQYGTWKGGVYINDKTNEFSHCAVSAAYKSGVTLFFSVTRRQKWQVGFSKKSWNLTVGKIFSVRYQVDRRQVYSGKAKARTKKLAVINLPGSSRLFNQMRRGRLLKVEAGDDLLKFNLTGTSNMLTKLLRCSRRNKNLYVDRPLASANSSGGTNSSNSFSSNNSASNNNSTPQKAPPKRRKGISPEHRQEAAQWFKSTLASSDVEYRVVPNQGSAQKMYKKNAIVWRVGRKTGIVGTMRIFPKRKPESMESSVLAYEARACKGDFASRFLKNDGVGTRNIRRLVTTCRGKDGRNWNVYYALADRDNGGTYLISVLSSKASADAVSQAGERVSGSMLMVAPTAANDDSEDDDLPSRDDKVVNF